MVGEGVLLLYSFTLGFLLGVSRGVPVRLMIGGVFLFFQWDVLIELNVVDEIFLLFLVIAYKCAAAVDGGLCELQTTGCLNDMLVHTCSKSLCNQIHMICSRFSH